MSEFYFTLNNGTIASREAIVHRLRGYCRGVIGGQPEWRARLDALVKAYGPECKWWRRRNGYLVAALCRDALDFAIWGDAEELGSVPAPASADDWKDRWSFQDEIDAAQELERAYPDREYYMR